MRVLLLEDEYTLRISIEEFLESIGYEVDGFRDGEDAYDAFYSQQYDILLLDVNVPGMSGFELLKRLREEGQKVPAIYLTARTQMSDLEEGYDLGCCDYVRKPFDLTELQFRITQACKSFYYHSENELRLAEGLVYDTKQFTLRKDDKNIELSKTEKEILGVLLRHHDQVVSIGMFQDEIWGEYVDPANIRVQINNLRKKLPKEVIKNRRGLGYIIER